MSLGRPTRLFSVILLSFVIGLTTASDLGAQEPPWSEFATGKALTESALVYDPDSDLLVAYGGRDKFVNKSSETSDALLVLDAGREDGGWLDVTRQVAGVAGPEAYSTAGVYFPTRKQVVFFAGKGLGDRVMALDTSRGVTGLRWLEPRVAGAVTSRRSHTAVYAPEMDAMIAFGGTIGNTKAAAETLDEVVVIRSHGPAFIRTVARTVSGPPARYDHSAIYDPTNQMMIVYGGQLTMKGPVYGDLWGLDLREPEAPRWVDLSAALSGDVPGPRSAHTAVYDPLREQMVVFGGKGATANEVWALNLVPGLSGMTWTKLVGADAPGSPGAVSDHTAVWVDAHDYMIVYGGTSRGAELDKTWMYHPADGAGHNWRPDPVDGCDAADPDSACGARMTVRVYLDVRCDGLYSPGYDRLLSGASVQVSGLDRVDFAATNARGSTHFSGLDVPGRHPLTVSVESPEAGKICGYAGNSFEVPGHRFGFDNFTALSIGLAPAR